MLVDVIDLVLPRRCVACRTGPGPLCDRCRPAPAMRAVPCGLFEVVAFADYDGALRRALIAYKERGRRDLARPLGRLLAASVRAAVAPAVPGHPVVLIGPPSTRSVAASRGGDHVVRLARAARRDCGLPVRTGVLRSTRTVRDSAGLSAAERSRNLRGSMAAAPARGASAVLVDDIVTTGATLREAHRALIAAGWPVLGAVAVAATPRRVRPSPLAPPTKRV